MRIQVQFKGIKKLLTYESGTNDAHIGDKVLVPSTWLSELQTGRSDGMKGTVVALESDYTGPVTKVLKISTPSLRKR